MTEIKSTAEVVSNSHIKVPFGNRILTLAQRAGVVGTNYYVDFGIEHLHGVASNPERRTVFEPGVGRGLYMTAALSLPNMEHGIGIDVNAKALNLTRENLDANGITTRCDLSRRDVIAALLDNFMVDLIMFDLPLIPLPEVTDLSPETRVIIDGGTDGRMYIDLMIQNAGRHLRPNGALFFVQSDFVGVERSLDMLKRHGFEPEVLGMRKKLLASTITTSNFRDHIESQGSTFSQDENGALFFNLVALVGTKS